MKILPILVIAVALAGCSVLPTEHSKSQGVKSAEEISTTQSLVVERIARGLAVANDPEVSSFRIEAHSRQEADTKAKATGSTEVTIPMGVKLALLGVGILILLFAISSVRRYSLAANAAYSLADSKMAGIISALRSRATLSTDAAQIAEAQHLIAEVEKSRGQLAARK
jgi:hypothetical protein